MHTGLLWFDNSDNTLEEKVKKAVDYYVKKYGRQPDLCLVHPSMTDGKTKEIEIGGLKTRTYRPVMPGHIWIGIEDKE